MAKSGESKVRIFFIGAIFLVFFVLSCGGGDGTSQDGTSQDGNNTNCGTSNETYSAAGTDNSAVVADGTTKNLTNPTITSDSQTSSQDNSSFYGLNAAVLAKNGGQITITCGSVTTTGEGANGVFSTGTGSFVFLSHVKISCTGGGGHGVDATQAATMTLENVEISTAGAHGAAIATDRGGGTITVTGGKMTTSGTDSPGIYSTGTITVTGAVISATGSEAAVIEGANFITLTDTTLSAAKGTRDRGLMIYQSMSGDAQGTKGTFTMTGGSFTWPETTGPAFYITNSTGVMTLKGVDFLQRFCLHILPRRFVRIRHYGLLSTCHKELLRQLQLSFGIIVPKRIEKKNWKMICREHLNYDPDLCPHCGKGKMVTIERLLPGRSPPIEINLMLSLNCKIS